MATVQVGWVIVPIVGAEGEILNVITTSSVLDVHGLFAIVQLKVYVLPAVPENVLVAEDGVVTVPPVPLIIDQVPVPTDGVFPAKVTDVKPQVAAPVWSGPALATVGGGFTVIVAVPVIVVLQLGADWYTTLTKLYANVPEVVVGAARLAVVLAPTFMAWFAPLLIL